MSKKRFIPINRRVSLIIIISLIAGIGGITSYLAFTLRSTIEESTVDGLIQEADLISTAIENFMLPGQASLAISYFQDFNNDPTKMSGYTIGLFRRNGQTAFSDDTTVSDVNQRLPDEMRFFANTEELPFPTDISESAFAHARGENGPPEGITFTSEDGSNTFLRIYNPLINDPRCQGCHGIDHTVRGIIDIRKDISARIAEQQTALLISGGLFAAVVLILALWLTNYLRAVVLRPVGQIGEVCGAVTEGDFEKRVSVKRNDEIGQLGVRVNSMVEGLYERYELSRYVSASTLDSLGSNREGRRVKMTMFFSDIRSFTSYSERNSAETVVSNLNGILNKQTEIIHNLQGDIDKYVGDEIVAMFASTEDDAMNACKAALRIQQALSEGGSAQYDGLEVGIGIHTGEVILGAVGSSQRADFTVIGDTVNAASRLCNVAQAGQIMISEETYQEVRDLVHVDGPFRLKVKGKEIYMTVYFLKEMLDANED